MAAYPGTASAVIYVCSSTDDTCIRIADTSTYYWHEPSRDMKYVVEALAQEPEPPSLPGYPAAWAKPYPPPHRLFAVPADRTRANPFITRILNPSLLARPPPLGRHVCPGPLRNGRGSLWNQT